SLPGAGIDSSVFRGWGVLGDLGNEEGRSAVRRSSSAVSSSCDRAAAVMTRQNARTRRLHRAASNRLAIPNHSGGLSVLPIPSAQSPKIVPRLREQGELSTQIDEETRRT